MRPVLVSLILVLLAGSALAKPRSREFILMRPDNSATMSGNIKDLERLKKVMPHERFFWFRDGSKEYLIKDAATIDQIVAVRAPAEALGNEMGKLGDKQGKLGEEQGKLGEQQGKLGEQQGELGEELGDLETREPANDSERAAIKQRVKAIQRAMRDLDGQMRALNDQMKVFEKPMRELDKQMRALDKQLEAAVAKADADMEPVLARAISSGAARPL